MFKQLQDMALFALVVECGSFSAAAKRAGLPKSSVSQRISQLERQIGLRLLNRTTRRLSLTFAGEHYLTHCREMVSASERAELAVQRLRDNPSGRLRITCPAGLGATLLARMNAAFVARYPEVSLEVSITDDVLDLVDAGFDVALRTGKPQDSSLIGRAIGHCPRYLLASPDYLARREAPEHPGQLVTHRCITLPPGRNGCCSAAAKIIAVCRAVCTRPIIFCTRAKARLQAQASRCCRRFCWKIRLSRAPWCRYCLTGRWRATRCGWCTQAASLIHRR